MSSTVLLQVDARYDQATDEMELKSAAFAFGAGHAVVPFATRRMSRVHWEVLRSPPATFRNAVAKGQAIRERLLSPEIGDVLERHAGHRLLLLADEPASGLPWELLETAAGNAPSITAGLVRRIKLAGDARRPPDRAAPDAAMRVLLVVDPTADLPGALREGDVVEDALGARADVTVERIDRADATLARVRGELASGGYDVLHYAGHARFDAEDRAHRGLLLAGREILTYDELAGSTVPRLVVLNACWSARVRASLPEAFLRAGVTTLVGSFFPVADSAALTFATVLYETLAAGRTIGDATRTARRALHDRRNLDWGNFLLYGDDTLSL